MSENIENMTVREAWHPYQRECGFTSQKKVEETEEKYRQNLDTQIKFWIKTQLLADEDPVEDDIPEYDLTCKLDEPIANIKKRIREQEGMEDDEKCVLIYKTIVLRDKKTLADYKELIEKERKNWANPYGGVIWICLEYFDFEKNSEKTKKQKYFVDDSAAKNLLASYNDI